MLKSSICSLWLSAVWSEARDRKVSFLFFLKESQYRAKRGGEKSLGKPKREEKQHWECAQSFTGVCEHYSYNFKRVHALTEHLPAEDLAHNVLYKALVPPQIVFPSLFKEAPVVGGVGDDTGLVHMQSACLASALWTQNELQLLLPRAGASSSPSSCLNVHCHGQEKGVGPLKYPEEELISRKEGKGSVPQRPDFYTQHLADKNSSISLWTWEIVAVALHALSLHSTVMDDGSQNEAEGPLRTSRAMTNGWSLNCQTCIVSWRYVIGTWWCVRNIEVW